MWKHAIGQLEIVKSSNQSSMPIIQLKQLDVNNKRSLITQPFDLLRGYGCWCHWEKEHRREEFRGSSRKVVNGFDKLCKKIHQDYRCLAVDAICGDHDPFLVRYNEYKFKPSIQKNI